MFQWLKKGTLLYHGTAAAQQFDIPDGPAWFSDAEAVGEWFAKRDESRTAPISKLFARPGDAPRRRVLRFRVTTSVRLARIDNREGFQRFLERVASEVGEATDNPHELARQACDAGLPGWTIPQNYPEGADILLCRPEEVLEPYPSLPNPTRTREVREHEVVAAPGMPRVVYHGTSRRAWATDGDAGPEGSTLYLTRNLRDASSYAFEAAGHDELDGHPPEPVVMAVKLADLEGLLFEPDWHGDASEDETWVDSLPAVGSFAVTGPIERYKDRFVERTPVE